MKFTQELKFIKSLSWEDVFEIWRQNEDYSNSHWIPIWQERGFLSWQDWRMTYAQSFAIKELEWGVYKINNPLLTVPNFCGGPFRSWVKLFYQGKREPSFRELANNPDIQVHQGIVNFMNNFPKQTTVTGLILNNKIIIIEGMHRCVCLGLAAVLGKQIVTDMNICLAKTSLKELPVVGQLTRD